MAMPAFSAEASIYHSSNKYRTHARHTPSEAGTIVPAPNGWPPWVHEPGASWGPLYYNGCIGVALEYIALWSGTNPAACASNPHPEVGHPPGAPCYGDSGGLWGSFYLPDWGGICSGPPDPSCEDVRPGWVRHPVYQNLCCDPTPAECPFCCYVSDPGFCDYFCP
jgi:hypothetical protein